MEKNMMLCNENPEILKNKDEVETSLKIFRQNVDHFFLATEINEKALDIQVKNFLNLIAIDVAEIHNQIESITEDESWNNVLNRFEKRCRINRNPLIYQYMFFNRTQWVSESFDNFYKDLKKIMSFCEFGNASENLMKTQIILGINNEKTRERLLEREMDLDYMIMYCHSMELFDKIRKLPESHLNSSIDSSINLECYSNNELSRKAACNGEAFLQSKTNSFSSNLNENNYYESEEYHLNHSKLNYTDKRKFQEEETTSEINSFKWKTLFSRIEDLCSYRADHCMTNKIVNGEIDAKDDNVSEKCSYYSNANSISNTAFVNQNVDRDSKHMYNGLYVIYQDYKLLCSILDVSKGQLCDDDFIAHEIQTSSIVDDSMKPWLSLNHKIVDWLESNKKGDILKKNLILKYNPMEHDLTNNQSSTSDKDDEQKKSKSKMIVEEIISTEKAFIDVLMLLCKTFVSFVEKDKDDSIIHPAELSKIFSPLPQILSLSKFMLADMELRLTNWNTEPKIADIIVYKGPFLKLYSTYIQNFKTQTNLLSECCKKYPRFGKCVSDFEALDVCNKLYIKQHMLAPIQRIPKYKLLLSRYLKSLDEDSIDYKNTVTAIDIISDVGQQIDKSVENGDCVRKLLNIQSKLRNYVIIKPGRVLIIEGELYKLSRKRTHIRYFILLNDILLYADNLGIVTGLKVKSELSLKDMKVVSKSDYEFSVITTTRSFSLRAQTAPICQKWISSLETTINRYNKRQQFILNSKFVPMYNLFQQLEFGYTAPVWIPDNSVTMCQLCAIPFSYFIRRHHCRVCGKVVCAKCSTNRAPLFYKKFDSVRVCDKCYELTLREFIEKMPSIVEEAYKSSDFKVIDRFENIKKSFKSKKEYKVIFPSISQTKSNDTNLQINDWLYQRSTRTVWKKFWFVLREQLLLVYKAPEDIVPVYKLDIFMYTVVSFMENVNFEEYDSNCVFQLSSNTMKEIVPIILRAENKEIAYKWIVALKEKTIL